jgi:hypothetical protein
MQWKPTPPTRLLEHLNDPGNHFLAYRIDSTESGGESLVSIYVAYNGWSDWVTANLPANLPGKHWFRVADTADWMESQDSFNVSMRPGGKSYSPAIATPWPAVLFYCSLRSKRGMDAFLALSPNVV